MVSGDLPEDVVINILSWLPVLSLMRFKSVCKSWCALIQSSTFMDQHFNHSTFDVKNGRNDTLLVKRRLSAGEKVAFFLLSGEKLNMSINLDIPYYNEHRNEDLEMVGCSNGIVCLYDSWFKDLALWNPATREFKPLPNSGLPHPPDMRFGGDSIGFGFDVKTNDYKVVRVHELRYKHNGHWAKHHVEIYNLSTDSWRLIDVVVPVLHIMSHYSSRAYVNGIYYWWGTNGLHDEMLLSFDMSNEVFRTTPLPALDRINGAYAGWRSFAALNESIAFIVPPPERSISVWERYPLPEKIFEVWVMDKYGVEESWTKLYSIGPQSEFGKPLGFWKDGKLFGGFSQSHEQEQLLLWDPVKQEKENLQIDGEPGSLQVLVYRESLISIRGGNDTTQIGTE